MKGAIYHESVMTTWDITFRKLQSKLPNAAKMLVLLGFLERSSVNKQFLENALTNLVFWGGNGVLSLSDDLLESFTFLDPEGPDFYEILGLLDSLSLIKRDETEYHIHVHPWFTNGYI